MGSLRAASTTPPIVEKGEVNEHFFTDFELEIFAGKCARFVLLQEQRPHYWEAVPAELTVEVKLLTCVDLIPGMLSKLVYELGRQWSRDAVRGLLVPFQ